MTHEWHSAIPTGVSDVGQDLLILGTAPLDSGTAGSLQMGQVRCFGPIEGSLSGVVS